MLHNISSSNLTLSPPVTIIATDLSVESLETPTLPHPSVIAIDGPVASGKTVVGRALAQRLGYRFIDTGLMYRAITAIALEKGVSPEEEVGLGKLARETVISMEGNGSTRVMAGAVDMTPRLHLPEVEQAVSYVSRVAEVRQAMVAQQRRLAAEGRTVMVGRDIGTHVLPDAPAKVFLLASPEERAGRRHRELAEASRPVPLEEVMANLELRDTMDSQRAQAPLRAAEDALQLQTDGLSVEQVVERLLQVVGDA